MSNLVRLPISSIFIPGNVPSSKNSRVFSIIQRRSFPSKATQKWERSTCKHWLKHRAKFLNMLDQTSPPYWISFKFVRGTKHKFDYLNPCQTVQDMMVRYRWLEDDNCDIMIPVFDSYTYDKGSPGVWIGLCLFPI